MEVNAWCSCCKGYYSFQCSWFSTYGHLDQTKDTQSTKRHNYHTHQYWVTSCHTRKMHGRKMSWGTRNKCFASIINTFNSMPYCSIAVQLQTLKLILYPTLIPRFKIFYLTLFCLKICAAFQDTSSVKKYFTCICFTRRHPLAVCVTHLCPNSSHDGTFPSRHFLYSV